VKRRKYIVTHTKNETLKGVITHVRNLLIRPEWFKECKALWLQNIASTFIKLRNGISITYGLSPNTEKLACKFATIII